MAVLHEFCTNNSSLPFTPRRTVYFCPNDSSTFLISIFGLKMDKGKDKSENILSLPVLMTQTMTTTSNTVEQEAEVEVKKTQFVYSVLIRNAKSFIKCFFLFKIFFSALSTKQCCCSFFSFVFITECITKQYVHSFFIRILFHTIYSN